MEVGVGFSCDKDTYDAVRSAVYEALKGSPNPDFSMVFTSGNYDHEVIVDTSRKLLGNSKVLGASIPGIITSKGLFTKGVAVFCVSGADIEAETFLYEDITCPPEILGNQLGKMIKAEAPDSGTIFCLIDGSVLNASKVLRVLYDNLGSGYSYLGGGNGDNLGDCVKYQFTQKSTSKKSVAVAVIKGIKFNFGVDHGWEPAGEPMIVTKAENKRIIEIDGVPAFKRYSACTGYQDKELFQAFSMKYPIGIPCYGGNFLIRDPIRLLPDDSIEFLTEVPESTVATIMTADKDSLADTAGKVTSEVLKSSTKPEVLIVFDCISRYLLLKNEYNKGIESIVKSAGNDIPLIGILTSGEICSTLGTPLFYNKSIVVAMGE